MKLSRKWLPASLTAIVIAGLLAGCPSKETAPDVAFKEAYTKLLGESFNYDGYITANIKFDETALIGTQGGLTPEEAQQELELVEELTSPDGKQGLAVIQNGKFTYRGAFDRKALNYDMILGADFELNGMKMAIEVPMLFTLKNEVAVYIDPKAGKAFNLLPPQLDGKLIKFSINDIPTLTAEQKKKFNDGERYYNLFEKLAKDSMQKLDASMIKSIAVSDAAKAAGATSAIQVTITPEQNEKMSKEMVTEVLTVLGPEFELTPAQIEEAKSEYLKSNDKTRLFMGNSVTDYGLNDKGQIVYMNFSQPLKGAKHSGDINGVMTLKDFGNPTFTVDPTKQTTVSFLELMMLMSR